MSVASILRSKSVVDARVIDVIHQTLAEERQVQPLSEEDWIRVSSIGELCPREESICAKQNVIRKRKFDGDQGVNFALGNAVHWMFQNRALPGSGALVGAWRCTWCGETYGGRHSELVPRPERCIRCGAIAGEATRSGGRPDSDVHPNAFVYVEEFVGNEEWRIGGHPDGYMAIGGEITLLEFKSANERNFGKYKDAPDFIHSIQAQVYLWLTGYKKAKIIYLNKNGGKDTFLREHDLDFDSEVIERVHAGIKQLRGSLESGVIPSRVVCATSSCLRAMNCQVRERCFSE